MTPPSATSFPRPLDSYNDKDLGALEKLAVRIRDEPLNIITTTIFFCAIVHAFIAPFFTKRALRLEKELEKVRMPLLPRNSLSQRPNISNKLQLRIHILHYLGEIELVFGFWAVLFALSLLINKGWNVTVDYLGDQRYVEPIFVVVIMTMAGSRTIIDLAESCLGLFAALGGKSPTAWWLSILTIGPLLGSLITEPAAMTVSASLLHRWLHIYKPEGIVSYASMGMLLVNISIGGICTNFAAPPMVMVASTWNWGLGFVFANFGWKVILSILVSNALHYLVLGRKLAQLERRPFTAHDEHNRHKRMPYLLTFVHILLIVWTVVVSDYTTLIIAGFFVNLGVVESTKQYQDEMRLRGPTYTGLFLSALLIHGGGQQWWVSIVLEVWDGWQLMVGATLMTAFNDNAAIAYLASLVPHLPETSRYAVIAGAVVGGGLTITANAPNPIAIQLLRSDFSGGHISHSRLFLSALGPTTIAGLALYLLPSPGKS